MEKTHGFPVKTFPWTNPGTIPGLEMLDADSRNPWRCILRETDGGSFSAMFRQVVKIYELLDAMETCQKKARMI